MEFAVSRSHFCEAERLSCPGLFPQSSEFLQPGKRNVFRKDSGLHVESNIQPPSYGDRGKNPDYPE